MQIDEYDGKGRTPLMNAAITGNIEEVERLLKAGANPLIADRDFGTTTAEGYAARFAKNSKEHQTIRKILKAAAASFSEQINLSSSHEPLRPEPDELVSRSVKHNETVLHWPFEIVRTPRGESIKRIRTSTLYLSAIISFSTGIYLIKEDLLAGVLLAFTITLCLILYPPIRFLFGGKDSLAAAITTVVAEELIKSQIIKKTDSNRRRRKR
ncbi:ankyrin repeat domain-containing protein [Franzmannia qiaohouensis]|uniref:Ankyrin repeat domain-containing protein n=1 Tax=Franzmannia qiaohouensis TaxID=1329370 RepID=A0ABU1HBM2_9GAMM|nr:ankyrin repeat domain-containing protein [Halomonas qiaohouensis]MDR5904867.1 ankyrin repeat domain-containing protein [Halomonas qiaohouensis]